MFNNLKQFLRDEEGQDFVEYAMLLAGIAVIGFVAVKALGGTIVAFYNGLSLS